MYIRKTEHGYLLRLVTGEELVAQLIEFFIEQELQAATFTAIGATTEITLGFYSLGKKEYHWKEFSGEFEIMGGVGNISTFEGKPVVHMHTSISDEEMKAFGGHVKRLVVGATCEVVLQVYAEQLVREADAAVGLNLWGL